MLFRCAEFSFSFVTVLIGLRMGFAYAGTAEILLSGVGGNPSGPFASSGAWR